MSAAPETTDASPPDSAEIADLLAQLLADSYTLYLKTHNYHWNVTGPHFGALHALFEVQYTDLAGDHETVAASAAAVIVVAQAAGDEPTAGMATTRQEIHQKAAWMLHSFLQ